MGIGDDAYPEAEVRFPSFTACRRGIRIAQASYASRDVDADQLRVWLQLVHDGDDVGRPLRATSPVRCGLKDRTRVWTMSPIGFGTRAQAGDHHPI
jgi:hypothetical protein